MGNIRVEPYMFFKGNCREAMDFYKSIFGGELLFTTYDQVGAAGEAPGDYIMHASLSGGDANLMASDTMQASETAKKVTISLAGNDEVRLRTIFDQLSDSVSVAFPLKKEAWGDIFGSLTDKYGIDWMINISQPKES